MVGCETDYHSHPKSLIQSCAYRCDREHHCRSTLANKYSENKIKINSFDRSQKSKMDNAVAGEALDQIVEKKLSFSLFLCSASL